VACAITLLGAGCTGLTSDLSQPVAIEFVLPGTPPLILEELDTVVVGVRVRDRAGDTLAGAPIQVVSLSPDTVGVDSAEHFGLFGIRAGSGRVVAISGSLQSDPLPVTVQAAADSLLAVGLTVDTVPAGDSLPVTLAVQLVDFHSTPGDTVGLLSRPVRFAITLPVFASAAVATVTLGNDSLTDSVETGGGPPNGAASVLLQRQGPPPQPDSVVVEARASRANGRPVPGSPVRFVVYFQ
jgi:hypothetical protein